MCTLCIMKWISKGWSDKDTLHFSFLSFFTKLPPPSLTLSFYNNIGTLDLDLTTVDRYFKSLTDTQRFNKCKSSRKVKRYSQIYSSNRNEPNNNSAWFGRIKLFSWHKWEKINGNKVENSNYSQIIEKKETQKKNKRIFLLLFQ